MALPQGLTGNHIVNHSNTHIPIVQLLLPWLTEHYITPLMLVVDVVVVAIGLDGGAVRQSTTRVERLAG
jgi:hypothetical protein